MRQPLTLIFFLIFALSVTAQVKVTGHVTDLNGKPVTDVIVKLTSGRLTIAYTTTEAKGGYTTLKRNKFISHRNKLYCNKRYVQKPNYYIPQGTYDHMNIIEMWPGGPEPAAEDKISVVATDMIIPKKVNKYQPLELK